MGDKAFDVVLFGATGYTGRQATVALLHRAATLPLRWAVAGRSSAKLGALLTAMVPASAAQPGVLIADAGDMESLHALASQARVLVNLAGPYAPTGEAVVQACIANRTHYLDLSGETFWVRQLIARHHQAATAAGVKVIPMCGYEALPFDLTTRWAAEQLRASSGEPCREVKILVSFRGPRVRSVKDAISGGTAATLKSLLRHDRSDSVRNPGCLLPPGTPGAAEMARRNAYHFAPHFDADVQAVIAPTIPAPFVNPPVVLRSCALLADATLFSKDFRYSEGMNMRSFMPDLTFLPESGSLPLQWAAAAALAAPLANLSAAIAGPLRFERGPLIRLTQWLGPNSGEGPSEDVLARSGYRFDVFATSVNGNKWRGQVEAQGHPGYRSTPEMLVTAALGLANGTLGAGAPAGIVTPSVGLGSLAIAAMREAGLRFDAVP